MDPRMLHAAGAQVEEDTIDGGGGRRTPRHARVVGGALPAASPGRRENVRLRVGGRHRVRDGLTIGASVKRSIEGGGWPPHYLTCLKLEL
jgi:hypothetical protein